ncbi:squalene synthase HpnC [Roseateles oligotrophus]|uniref:Squalene synthase HpnC n=1 Tax=Roseateles oligotrophus TaxID=1769250 RepID=A0ABT2YBC8_9BURK|nr:squalene synthase HpnC [Roseateles oligotrophus]MCV2367440.1 squalene synthase HpnC [Roseateles oligotrophus]
MSIEHYENFPVASWLCPKHLRPAVAAIYHFARTADDLADEGDAGPVQRQADLQAYREDMLATAAGRQPSVRWAATVFTPLAAVLRQYRLPLPLLNDLISAFEQDLQKNDYYDRPELLDYCSRSANPVGRLLLHLYGIDDPLALQRSDAICSSLQLINFWQDFSRDGPLGRVYAPLTDLQRHGVNAADLLACRDSPAARALIKNLCEWAERLMLEGAPLVHQIPGRAGWELRLVVQGGLRILAKIKTMHYASLIHRPALHSLDAPALLWGALRMSQSGKKPIVQQEESL